MIPAAAWRIALVVAVSGCQCLSPSAAPVSLDAFRAAQAARVERSHRVMARGTLEVRWADADGRHFESADAQWWIDRPQRSALLLKKLGERMALAGADGASGWLIDLRARPAQLRLIDGDGGAASWADAIPPAHLVWLMGMGPLPAEPPTEAWVDGSIAWAAWGDLAIGWDAQALPVRAWVGRGERMRAEAQIDPRQWRGMAGAPTVPGHVGVRSMGRDASADLYLYEPAPFDAGTAEKVLDLATIRAALQPELVP